MTETLLGAVLAGGAGRRLGRDKAVLTLGGRTLLARAVATLHGAFDRVVVVSSTPRPGPWTVIEDSREHTGPLAGIESALGHAAEIEAPGVFVLACDLPLVTSTTVSAIAAALDDHPAAAPARAGVPGYEPLCAVYGVGCLTAVTSLLDSGERAAASAFERVGGLVVDDLPSEFLNVNTEADLERARLALGGRPA